MVSSKTLQRQRLRKALVCIQCSGAFDAAYDSSAKRCPDCRQSIKIEMACALCGTDLLTDNTRQKYCPCCAFFRNRQSQAAYARRYRQTEEGRLQKLKQQRLRTRRSTDIDLYINRLRRMRQNHESCFACGAVFREYTGQGKHGHQLDHIVALCNGGRDEEDNYQVLCFPCHTSKTAVDLALYYSQKSRRVAA